MSEASDIVIDLGGISITVGEMLEIIKEEKQKLLEKYGARDEAELEYILRSGRLDLEEILYIRHRLMVLDEMEEAVFEEIMLRNSGLKLTGITDFFKKILGLRDNGRRE